MTKDKNTENIILEAAQKVFEEKGFDGARMRDIAERANTNKGLLHYYFKTKEALFQIIFSKIFQQLISQFQSVLESDLPLDQKIDQMVDKYMDLMSKNPSLPTFVLSELSKNSELFVEKNFDSKVNTVFAQFEKAIEKEVSEGRIKPINAHQLLIDLLGLVLFPFIGKPILQTLFKANQKIYEQIINERRGHIKEILKRSLEP